MFSELPQTLRDSINNVLLKSANEYVKLSRKLKAKEAKLAEYHELNAQGRFPASLNKKFTPILQRQSILTDEEVAEFNKEDVNTTMRVN